MQQRWLEVTGLVKITSLLTVENSEWGMRNEEWGMRNEEWGIPMRSKLGLTPATATDYLEMARNKGSTITALIAAVIVVRTLLNSIFLF
jgi:hypothetical protein